MKKIILTFIVFALILNFLPISSAKAISPTPNTEKTASPTSDIERIEKIKEMVASKVAELKLVEKKGILGTVTEASTTQVSIVDANNNKRIIDIDELTKFQDASNKTFGISDIKKDDQIGAIGLYNKETERLLARFIIKIKSIPVQFDGLVISIDSKNFTLKAVNEKGEIKTIDFSTSTKTQSYTKEEGMKKTGFSKIELGQRILATGFYNLKDNSIIEGSRVIHFINVLPSREMKKFEGIEETNSSTGSGKKLTPITK